MRQASREFDGSDLPGATDQGIVFTRPLPAERLKQNQRREPQAPEGARADALAEGRRLLPSPAARRCCSAVASVRLCDGAQKLSARFLALQSAAIRNSAAIRRGFS